MKQLEFPEIVAVTQIVTTKPNGKQAMPVDSKERKNTPLVSGVLDYFPAALAAVARLSKFGNDKHNPGEDLHWARGKSNDHADCIARHLVDRGVIDPETGMSHTVEVAWRALALLQLEEEERGAPMARGAR
jgi:dATP/dGTP diphosphohydrolase